MLKHLEGDFSPEILRDPEPMCLPTLPCVRFTPYGEAEGSKCALGAEVNHNTNIRDLAPIISRGVMSPGIGEWKDEEWISFSACPTQSFSGPIKLVFDSSKLVPQMRSMCYVDFGWVSKEKVEDWTMAGPEGHKYLIPGKKMESGSFAPYYEVEKGMEQEAHAVIEDGDYGALDGRIMGSNAVAAKVRNRSRHVQEGM